MPNYVALRLASLATLTIFNSSLCSLQPEADEEILLKTPLHELPSPRDVWDVISAENGSARQERLGGGILVELLDKVRDGRGEGMRG